jgi:hypothetical protein
MQLAVSTDNRDYARFLYDAMMFEMFPYWMPALAGCALVTACAGLIQVSACAVWMLVCLCCSICAPLLWKCDFLF